MEEAIAFTAVHHSYSLFLFLVAISCPPLPYSENASGQYIIESNIIATDSDGSNIRIASIGPLLDLAIFAPYEDVFDLVPAACKILEVDVLHSRYKLLGVREFSLPTTRTLGGPSSNTSGKGIAESYVAFSDRVVTGCGGTTR